MNPSDSIYIYEDACRFYKRYVQNAPTRYISYEKNNRLKEYYARIIHAMFYELFTIKESKLLSWLCSANSVEVSTAHYKIRLQRPNSDTKYDLYPLLVGLNTAIARNLDECYRLFDNEECGGKIFRNLPLGNGFDYTGAFIMELRKLDNNIGSLLAAPAQGGMQQRALPAPKKDETRQLTLRMPAPELSEQLNKLAEERKANDAALSGQIEQLQISLQNELKQILEIREGISYNTAQEAISQFISLFTLLNDTLRYHPGSNVKEGYDNLIESCEELLENILQALALLGVAVINDVGESFDPKRHKAVQGMQPGHFSTVTKVVKVGFSYKDKILEKAEVEIN